MQILMLVSSLGGRILHVQSHARFVGWMRPHSAYTSSTHPRSFRRMPHDTAYSHAHLCMGPKVETLCIYHTSLVVLCARLTTPYRD